MTQRSGVRPRRVSPKNGEPALELAEPEPKELSLAADDGRDEQDAKPRYRAEDLIYEAWEATGPRRAALARKALALWPDCADAYVLLAQAASSLEHARELLEDGVAAGERALGHTVFTEEAGEFWLIFETRPYMRARAALAAVLWRLGRHEEAVEHQRELLRLNPRDNQALRYRQANWLLQLESYDELKELFAAHADDRAPGFVYTQALAAFARRGDNATSRALRAKALKLNPHMPAYLTGRSRLPDKRPDYTVFGEESEAVDYAAGAGALWASVPGALNWLES
jgi:tetratricopeptide (TPR) repeat protein